MRSLAMSSAMRAWLAAGALVLLPIVVPAQVQIEAPPAVARASADVPRLPHSDASVAIDGVLDDAIWKQALVVDLTVETSPGENIAAPVETHAYLVEDGSRLLIAFDARDPEPDKIRAYLRDRDSA
ncbi:MAG TPA: hypothetical protein VFO94_19010, partial [Gammaproteobacteria bacterium]|nr:hypothetical protein [Gammaproteobacteria bacterium]